MTQRLASEWKFCGDCASVQFTNNGYVKNNERIVHARIPRGRAIQSNCKRTGSSTPVL